MTHIPDEAVQAAQEEYRNQANINNWGSSWPSFESMESIVSAAVAHLPKTSVIITEKSIYEAAKRSYEYEGDRKGIYYIGFENEPEDTQEQWRNSVKEAIIGALPYLSATCAEKLVDVSAVRRQAFEEAAQLAEKLDTVFDSKVGSHAASAIRALSAEPVQGDHIASVGKMVEALKETRIDLVVLSGNIADAEKSSDKWEGMYDRVRSWIDRIDAALPAAPTPEAGK